MDINPDKLLAQLEAEKAKRAAAKVDSGEVLVIREAMIVESEDDIGAIEEGLKAAAREQHPGRELIFDFQFIVSGVPRSENTYKPGSGDANSLGAILNPGGEPASADLPLVSTEAVPAPQGPTYVQTSIRRASEDGADPGAIAEGWFSVSNGILMLEDCDGVRIGSQPLRVGEDPLAAARRLLRERNSIGSAINYPKLRLA